MARSHFTVEVSRVRQLTDRVKEFLLVSPDGNPLPEYGPGAHIAVQFTSPTRGLMVRHYSLIGGTDAQDDTRSTYRIAVQRESDTRGSAHIHATFAPGTSVTIGAPVNNFPLDRRAPNVLLIAGGIGVTPIVSMARSLARRKRPFTVFYAGRDKAAMAYHDTLAALTDGQCTFHYSDRDGVPDLTALLSRQSADTTVYVCGPTPMVDAAHAAATALNWHPDRVRSERFGAAQTSAPHAFDVHLARSGKTIRVSEDASILDALNAEGVPVLWDCRRGECGLCPVNVVSADGAIEHNDRYLTDDEKASGQTMCICVSRVTGRELVLDA